MDAISASFAGIGTAVAVSNIYEPFLESDWPLMMAEKSWYDEDGVGGDGTYHGSITTTARDLLSPSEGDVCYNTTTSTFQKYLSSSWGTTYRGPQREFPSRAVAVAEASKVIIYDLTQSEPVMWMVFVGGNLNMLRTVNDMTSVEFRGGILYAGSSGYRLKIINFLTDSANTAGGNDTVGPYLGAVKERNDGNGTASGGLVIISSAINDIATTQLPQDARLADEYDVIPVTWAVATNGGVSVGRTDGNVWDLTFTNGDYNNVRRVNLAGSRLHLLASYLGLADDNFNHIVNLPNADHALVIGAAYAALDGRYYRYDSVPSILNPTNSGSALGPRIDAYPKNGYLITGSNTGLTLLKENLTTPAEGMVNYLTTDYQSGWLAGDIKGAWLADSDDTDAVGSELVTNGTFDSDTSGWTEAPGDGSIAIDTARVKLTRGASSNCSVYQDITTIIGETYTLSWEVDVASDAQGRKITIDGVDLTSWETGTGLYSGTFIAADTAITVAAIQGGGGGAVGYFDNITCRLADIDRSVNGNGLQIHGTITKTALGGDGSLVAYSGYSAANYFSQPYNSDLDFGTGDFYMLGWVKVSSFTVAQRVLYRAYYSGSWSGSMLYISVNTSGNLAFTISDDGAATSDTVGHDISENTWVHLAVRRAGASLLMSVNGELVDTTAIVSAAGSLSNTNATLMIGRWQNTASQDASESDTTLWRIGAGAPSSEDIEFIYKQEKPLIVNGSDATLGGSSDAIASLAWDDYKKPADIVSASDSEVIKL